MKIWTIKTVNYANPTDDEDAATSRMPLKKPTQPIYSLFCESMQAEVQEQLVVILVMLGGIFQNKTENFHEGLNSDCHTLLIYRDSFDIRTIKVHRDFFTRRYNIDAHPFK